MLSLKHCSHNIIYIFPSQTELQKHKEPTSGPQAEFPARNIDLLLSYESLYSPPPNADALH